MPTTPGLEPIDHLIDQWCERRDLRPLSILLPAHLWNNGLTDGWADLMEALRNLRAARILPGDEQRVIENVLLLVENAMYRSE